MLTPEDFLNAARSKAGRLVELRRTIHANPELAFEEYETAALVGSVHDELGIDKQTNVAKTGVVATLRGGKATSTTKCVALRGDMDALPIQEETGLAFASRNPGKMHACGHDSHTTMALGAAMLLNDLRDVLPGTVKFLHQPSEEVLPGGASVMVREGALENVDAVFGQHVLPLRKAGQIGFYPGTMMASADEIYITITGKSGHAAIPHEAIDPVLAASEIVLLVQKIISRTLSPFEKGVVTISSIHGGTATNIIPDEVHLKGTLRAMDEEWRKGAKKRLEKIIQGVCLANGTEYDLEIRHGYPALDNDPWATELAKRATSELLGEDNVFQAEPMMGAEDFAYYLQKIPGSFWWIGAGTEEQGCIAGLHNSKFTIDESILPVGSAVMAWVAYKYLMETASS